MSQKINKRINQKLYYVWLFYLKNLFQKILDFRKIFWKFSNNWKNYWNVDIYIYNISNNFIILSYLYVWKIG